MLKQYKTKDSFPKGNAFLGYINTVILYNLNLLCINQYPALFKGFPQHLTTKYTEELTVILRGQTGIHSYIYVERRSNLQRSLRPYINQIDLAMSTIVGFAGPFRTFLSKLYLEGKLLKMTCRCGLSCRCDGRRFYETEGRKRSAIEMLKQHHFQLNLTVRFCTCTD